MTTPPPTPEEIEAAARAIHARMKRVYNLSWEEDWTTAKDWCREWAKAALKAAMAVRSVLDAEKALAAPEDDQRSDSSVGTGTQDLEFCG